MDLRHDGKVHRKLFDEDSRHSPAIQIFRALESCPSVIANRTMSVKISVADTARQASHPDSVYIYFVEAEFDCFCVTSHF